ncbi:hypothetical protein DLAC_06256 [Tieghemostelium lacteum]|uniref:CBS domain-containing protein n=1 Tax=Tieghemostelium lacteum TaxID=361077 RepID=A0A151ZEH7_TIELA|nr:hypothetical protein DLAC_06256 [Tieghemostelium lacteum]|eukprot:KYQ92294.1 hypothetical protein DLAC_06256 [Tieghemostelium lacteum]
MINSPGEYWVNKREEMNLITIKEGQTIDEAIELFSKNKILSLPVMEKTGDECIGFIDMNDVLATVITHFTKLYEEKTRENPDQSWVEWRKLNVHDSEFDGIKVETLINKSRSDEYVPVDENGTLYQLIEDVFANGIHRVLVYDENAKMKGLISQSDLFKFFIDNISEIGSDLDIEICTLGIINKNVIKMGYQLPAIHAYYLMILNRLPCIALVNERDEIIGNLSITDLRGLDKQSLKVLGKPAYEFWNINSKKRTFTCAKGTSLKDVITDLQQNKVHRLWITDNQSKCNGVISQHNIMNYLVDKYCPKSSILPAN